jgi:DNA-binding IclR family transcriptional regulator
MLAVLDVFKPDNPVCTAEDVSAGLGYSLGTAYRYIRELVASGLLARTETGFCLGPRIIELDLAIRQCDPVLAASQPMMRELRDRFGCDVLLIQFFNDRVVVSHHVQGDDRITVSYGRGKVMPLFRGAGSKVLLAALPRARQRRLYEAYAGRIAAEGLGEDWKSFRKALDRFETDRYAISIEELDKGNVGVGVPIGGTQHGLVLVFSTNRYTVLDKAMVREATIAAAATISFVLNAQRTGVVGNHRLEIAPTYRSARTERADSNGAPQ